MFNIVSMVAATLTGRMGSRHNVKALMGLISVSVRVNNVPSAKTLLSKHDLFILKLEDKYKKDEAKGATMQDLLAASDSLNTFSSKKENFITEDSLSLKVVKIQKYFKCTAVVNGKKLSLSQGWNGIISFILIQE